MKLISTLFGLIIGFAFTAGGIFIALETAIPTYQSWAMMQSWQSTSARLINVDQSSNNTQALYRYAVAGVEYQNDRVYVATFKDTIGSYHKDMGEVLTRHKANNQLIHIWYNPEKPMQSVIDRDMRWGLFALMTGFCLLFVLIGLIIINASLKKDHQSRRFQINRSRPSSTTFRHQHGQQERTTDLGSEPWLNNTEWQSHRIRSGAKKSMVGMWFFAIIWTTLSSSIFIVVEKEFIKGNYAVLLGLLFPLVGFFLIIKAFRMTREWQRFGVIELDMDPFPGSIGGHVGGTLLLKSAFDFNAKYNIELECVHSAVSGSSKSRSRKENIKWAEAGFAKVVTAGRGLRLKFRFDIPDHLPESDVEQTGDFIFWRLKVSADLPGINLDREYNIPVFKTHQHSTSIDHNVSVQVEEIREIKSKESLAAINNGNFASTPLARALRFKNINNKQIFYFPMFRNKLLTLVALIFAAGFGFAAFSIKEGFSDGGVMAIAMFIFSFPFALVGLIASIAVIYLPFNNLTVTLAEKKIKALRRLFIFPIKYDVIKSKDIKTLEIKSSGSKGQGTKQIKHYQLIACTNALKKVTIAEDIDGEELANQLKDFICRRLLIPT